MKKELMEGKKSIAIITARGGSKRIPYKNIKPFRGKPIIAYSIETTLNSGLFDEVMVSTDDAKIVEIAKQFGAKIPFMRSDKNADDYAGTAEVLLEVLEDYRTKEKLNFDYACCIYPTAPFVTVARLREGYELMINRKYDVVFAVAKFDYPIQRSLHFIKDKLQMIYPENELKRSQDLPSAYHDAGQFYWFDIATFVKEKTLFGNNVGGIILSALEVQDIDTETDWKLAELKHNLLFR
jgi:pseudaminic acid cytidylyltransferase